jgi:uncharacterized protein YceK
MKFIFMISLFLLSVTSCSTYKTLNSATLDSPVVFSGTRLNMCAISQDKVAMQKFNTKPVEYPYVDLPASFLLDFLMFPLTVSAAISNQLNQ